VVITALATFESAVEAMKRGATDYLPKPFTPDQVRQAIRRAVDTARLKRELAEATARLDHAGGDDDFWETSSPAFTKLLAQSERVAASDVPVLLRGPSGTGKNVLARRLWLRSPRSSGPFVSVNCPSLSTELMHSALFGHRKGAFTGAVAEADGKVQEAEGGVLFLDEVGDLTMEAQVRLLRFLNDRSYERVGEAKERRANVRIVTATNHSLEDDVRAGRFREDLLFRLNVVTLTLPALRERHEDIQALAAHYLGRARLRQHRPELEFSEGAERAIVDYGWPGNLREMKNAIERALILAPGPRIEPADLGIPPAAEVADARLSRAVLGADVPIEAVEREHIARVIARASTLEAAARTLGIDSTTLQRKRKRYGLT
jgi:NtrC-family two-component system response regulator AlgB